MVLLRPERKRRWDRENYICGLRPRGRPGHLNKREIQEIYELLDQGFTQRQVADQLGIGQSTVCRRSKKRPPTFSDEGPPEERSQIRSEQITDSHIVSGDSQDDDHYYED